MKLKSEGDEKMNEEGGPIEIPRGCAAKRLIAPKYLRGSIMICQTKQWLDRWVIYSPI